MTAIVFHPAKRAEYVAQLTLSVGRARIPGGDLAAWVAPLPTEFLAVALLYPRHRRLEALFVALCGLRAAPAADDLSGEAIAAVPRSHLGRCCIAAWSTCRLAREAIDRGEPEGAQMALRALTRWIHEWPSALARRFEPRIEALYAEAERALAHHRAHEVA